jgi:hypothetical protein
VVWTFSDSGDSKNHWREYIMQLSNLVQIRGGSRERGEGAHPAHAPLKLENIWFFGIKSWFFTRNTPKIFAPPSTRRNFFKCPPLTWNFGSASENELLSIVLLSLRYYLKFTRITIVRSKQKTKIFYRYRAKANSRA